MNFYIAQGIGIIIAVIAIASVQLKNLRKILICQIVVNTLSALNYTLLGGLSGAGVNLFAIVQTIWIYLFNIKNKPFPMTSSIGCMVVYLAISLFSFSGFPTVLSCTAALLYALSVMQTDAKKYRVFCLFNSLVWIGYDVYTCAYTTIFTHGFLVISILTAMYRLDRKKAGKSK